VSHIDNDVDNDKQYDVVCVDNDVINDVNNDAIHFYIAIPDTAHF